MKLEEKIKQERTGPLIAVIGSTTPSKPYELGMGVTIGYELRKSIDPHNGSLFTGGVEGVGIDVYTGIMKYCIDQVCKPGLRLVQAQLPEDRFFVLIPEYQSIYEGRKNVGLPIPYNPPREYELLASLSTRGSLDIQRGGQDMAERREILAHVADVLIMVNGSAGTFDEGVKALGLGKPVIAMNYSGGAALLLSTLKENNFSKEFIKHLSFDQEELRLINPDLISIAHSTQEMIDCLTQYWK